MSNNLTWSEMYNYLIQQENCIVQYKEFKVVNVHETVQNLNEMIMMHEPKERSFNGNCKNLKLLLTKIYELHKQNKFKLIKHL